MKKFISCISFLLLIVGCGKSASTPPLDTTIHISTTLYPITYFVERIGGSNVTVTPIVENGADAHSYEPTIQQLQLATDSQIFFYIDPTVESFMSRLLPTIESGSSKIVSLGEAVEQSLNSDIGNSITLQSGTLSTEISTPQNTEEADHDHEHLQNHIWLYPPYAITMAKTILNELLLLMPDKEAVLYENYTALEADLIKLDDAFKELSNAPKPYFLVTHAAYTTWEYYGLHQIPITGVLASDEPTQKELIDLIETSRNLGLNYIFYEQNLPSGNGTILEEELKLQSIVLYNLATITKEELNSGKDYFTLMYENIHNLKQEVYSE
ncbi:MAG TPA: hypothetical protein DCY20_11815 [Firmicutes bacterium]|nr:hypothetical protein [Bacillota bacterium]